MAQEWQRQDQNTVMVSILVAQLCISVLFSKTKVPNRKLTFGIACVTDREENEKQKGLLGKKILWGECHGKIYYVPRLDNRDDSLSFKSSPTIDRLSYWWKSQTLKFVPLLYMGVG